MAKGKSTCSPTSPVAGVTVRSPFAADATDGQSGSVQRDLVVRTAAPRDVTGRLFISTSDGKSMVMVRFKIPASRANAASRQAFYELKQRHYEQLLAQGVPGAAWFRHEARQAQRALGHKPGDVADNAAARASRSLGTDRRTRRHLRSVHGRQGDE